MLKVIELFAGIGAQRKALQKAEIEHEVIAISEIDKYAIQSYNAIHGETLNLGDITKIGKMPEAAEGLWNRISHVVLPSTISLLWSFLCFIVEEQTLFKRSCFISLPCSNTNPSFVSSA